MKKTVSQKQKVLNYLLKGRTLTSMQAIRWWGCTRLASRINELRKVGWNIETDHVNKRGDSFGRYRLVNNIID
jgi:hypothetical protein